MSFPVLQCQALRLAYGAHEVVRGVDFTLGAGRIACLLGPSGCGKTTVLRAIAGFEPLRDGEIRFDGRVVASRSQHQPPEARGMGMVFQDYALFPHLDVAANVGFGLGRLTAPERLARVRELLALVGLGAEAGRFPHELSGGQQQRVALARALAPRPALVLLDEPFSNLDSEMRERLALEVREILRAAGTAAILVTHDQHEAFAMADEIGVMHEGRIQQWGEASTLYHLPANRFVADFVGQGALVRGRVEGADGVRLELGRVVSALPDASRDGDEVDVLLRPDALERDPAGLPARVLRRAFRGAEIVYTLSLPSGQEVLASLSSVHEHAIGEQIGLRLAVSRAASFAR